MNGIIQVDSWPWNLVKEKERREELVVVEKWRSGCDGSGFLYETQSKVGDPLFGLKPKYWIWTLHGPRPYPVFGYKCDP
ncbi:hypothetical protein L484_027714 [Morus notabilis]|uniref:Uncharacterized protein n=1 Tax=Morus notabilis TaxID=981085 RepID=W9RCK3_9ROSA|nr:hypothetical protein L484_027714 [Morus notabilis]